MAKKAQGPKARFEATTEALRHLRRLMRERELDWGIEINPFLDEIEPDEDHIFMVDEGGDIGSVCLAAGCNGYRLEIDGRVQFENGVLWNIAEPAIRFVEAQMSLRAAPAPGM